MPPPEIKARTLHLASAINVMVIGGAKGAIFGSRNTSMFGNR